MRIFLLGATGRTGRVLLDQALGRGYSVNALVRDPEKVTTASKKLHLFKGTPTDVQSLKEALSGCNYIINVLNVSRRSDFPWSALRAPENLVSKTIGKLIPLAKEQNIRRIITCSAWGTSETKKDLPYWFRWFINNSNIGAAYKDHERQEMLIMGSGLDWTIVRPAGLTNSNRHEEILTSYRNEPKPQLTISRSSLSRFMLDALDTPQLVGRSPVISSK